MPLVASLPLWEARHRALQVQLFSHHSLLRSPTSLPHPRNRAVQLPPGAPVAKPGKNKLGTVYAFVTGRELVGAHNAVADVQALDQVTTD